MNRSLPVRISPMAERDLEQILEFISEDKPLAALKFITRLRGAIDGLAQTPDIGRERPELGPRVRSLPFKKYVIFYRASNKEVTIARVLQGALDLTRKDAMKRSTHLK